MARERLYLFDTTLRDGAQTNGVDFTLNDKLAIARMLDDLGIDYIEGGYPGANLTDTQLFAEERGLNATFTAFGMARRPGRSTSNDPGLAALLEAKADAICFVAKSWDYHVRVALETSAEENLASIRDSVRAAVRGGREVLLDCEHFFDGYKADARFALACAKAAYDEGARWVVLCDTNGGALPHEVEAIVGEVVAVIPGSHVGIHAHNDTEQAVANSRARSTGWASDAATPISCPSFRRSSSSANSPTVLTSACRRPSSRPSRMPPACLTRCSIARPTGTLPMSAKVRSRPRPAFTPLPS
jgi:2-isopropylmalate synthase